MSKNEIPNWFKSTVHALFALYPQSKMSPATVIGWWAILGKLTREQLKSAIAISVSASPQFIPSAPAVLCAIQANSKDLAISSWPEILEAAKRSRGKLSDPLAEETVRHMGGFRRLGQMDWEELNTWGKKEFERIYCELSERDEIQKRLGVNPDQKMIGDVPHVDISGVIKSISGRMKNGI